MRRFGPPPPVTEDSAWPWIDHSASGLLPATERAVRTRFRSGFRLAAKSNSQAHYAKGMRSSRRTPTVCGHMISGSVSLPSSGFFSPFPHGTGSLSVTGEYLALEGGPPGFGRSFTCSVLLGIPAGRVRISRTGLSPSAVELSRSFRYPSPYRNAGPATPMGKPIGLGWSAFARHYLRSLG